MIGTAAACALTLLAGPQAAQAAPRDRGDDPITGFLINNRSATAFTPADLSTIDVLTDARVGETDTVGKHIGPIVVPDPPRPPGPWFHGKLEDLVHGTYLPEGIDRGALALGQ